jgi:hypothetical protein
MEAVVPTALDAAVAKVARPQHGLITTAQALDTGLTRAQIHHRRQAGRWTEIEPGLHLVAGVRFTWKTRVMAACLVTGGVASHRSAAVLLDVIDLRPGRPEVTVSRRRRVHRGEITVHQSTDLRPDDVIRIDGIPTTRPVRLAMDLGATVSFPVYERSIDDLIARKQLRWEDMADHLCRLSRRGRNGLGPARALLLERYGDDVPDSVLERAFRSLVRGAGLPEPVGQLDVSDGSGFVARVDFAYPDHRVVVELDGRRHHLHAEAFEADRAKRNRLQLAGWRVLVWTWKQVIQSGPTVTRQLRSVLVPV